MGDCVKLTNGRIQLATVLDAQLDAAVSVIDHLPDSVTPPTAMIGWGDPWITKATLCQWTAKMEVFIVAQRLEPGGQYQTLEEIVSDAVTAIESLPYYSIDDVTSPYPLQIGGVDYLAASINITYEVEE